MLSFYPALFIKEKKGYCVIFPDLNYLATCGDTLEESFKMATDCLAGYLYLLQEENTLFPTPSELSELNIDAILKDLDAERSENFVNVIAVDVEEYAETHFKDYTEQTILIPTWLNEKALYEGVDFSEVLQNALMQIIK